MASGDNNPEGLCNFGRCLELGVGIPQDAAKAVELYRLAAGKADVLAQ
jgi:TPR repeat protein